MSSINIANANIILDRVKKAYKLKNDTKLADFLAVNTSTVSSWRKRNSMKIKLLIELTNDLNMNWLFFGDLPVWRNEIKKDGDVVMLQEPAVEYGRKMMIEKIKALDISPDEKLELLNIYIKVLEQLEAKK